MEKIKDLFYDVSDVLLSVLIIAIMFYTISWKLSDTMSYTPSFNIPFISSEDKVPETPIAVADKATHVAIGDQTPAIATPETTPEATPEVSGEVVDMPKPEPATEIVPEATPQEAAKPEGQTIEVIQAKDVNFVVPSGMLASKIIQKLKDEGLIQDKSAFTARLSERKLDSKLRSGTFKLRTDMTDDQIINKLTGQ